MLRPNDGYNKVTLVRGPIIFEDGAFNNEATPPIGLAYIAGFLKEKGFSVEIVDAIGEALNQRYPLSDCPGFSAQGLTPDEVVARIPGDTQVIGFSAMFSGEWPANRSLVERIRREHPNALIIAGGEHATALPEYILRDCPAIDFIVKGEGENTIYEVLDGLSSGVPPSEIGGIAFVDEAGIFRNTAESARIRELDAMPWPYWPEGLLERFWAAGKSHGVLTERDMPMLASRGCPYRCTFCSNPQMWTTRYVLREPAEVIREIRYYKEKYDITSVQFYDLTAITKRKWIIEFCKELIRQEIYIKWSLPAGTRSEVLDQETLTLVKQSGCHYLVYAPESGSPETLERIKKRIKLDRLTESMLTAKKLGIVLRANLIIGFPGESRRDVWKTLRYGLKVSWCGVDEVAVFLFSPYPGSELFQQLHDCGAVKLSDNYFLSLTSLNGKFNTLTPKVYNENMKAFELAIYRTGGMLLAYLIGYLHYPSRIVRTIRNLVTGDGAATVLEHRLRDTLLRRRDQSA